MTWWIVRIIFILFISVFLNINLLFSTEYVCVFDAMLTSDIAEYYSDYDKILESKSMSKFVFDITEDYLVVNGEKYISVYPPSQKDSFSVYSNKDFPYVMFHFYPVDEKLVILGMQESKNDTFLKSDVLECYKTNSKLPNSKLPQKNIEIIPKPFTSSANLIQEHNTNQKPVVLDNLKENIIYKIPKEIKVVEVPKEIKVVEVPKEIKVVEVPNISMIEIIIPPPE